MCAIRVYEHIQTLSCLTVACIDLITEQALVKHEVTYRISFLCGLLLGVPLVTITIFVYKLCNAFWLFVAYVSILVCNYP